RARRRLGRPAEAEAAYREALDIQRRSLGADHPEVAKNMVFLADLIRDFRADTAGAEQLYRRSLAMIRGRLGERHPALLHPLEQIALVHSTRGEHAEAERLYREGLTIRRGVFGRESPMVAIGIDLLAGALARQGRAAEAEEYYREALALLKGGAPESEWTWAVSGTQATLGDLLTNEGRYEEAERLYRSALAIRARIHGEEHFGYALVLAQLGRLKAESGDSARAITLYERALEIGRETRTASHPDVKRLRRELAEIRRSEG
ncbi:MAG: tetratricopeptide repeat protein, partial [Gemmatimonadota bacterium]|nr:tetratricopeptide repeat protein [Gemmatimonadota bacterium]